MPCVLLLPVNSVAPGTFPESKGGGEEKGGGGKKRGKKHEICFAK